MIKLLDILNEWKIQAPIRFKKGDHFVSQNGDSEVIILGPPVKGYNEADRITREIDANLTGDNYATVLSVYIDDVGPEDDEAMQEQKKLELEGYFYPVKFLKGRTQAGKKVWDKNSYFSEAYILRLYFPKLGLHQFGAND